MTCEGRSRSEAPLVAYMGGRGGVVGSDCAVWPGVATRTGRATGSSTQVIPAGRRDVRRAAGILRPAVASNRAWVVGPDALNALRESLGNRWRKKSEVQAINRQKTSFAQYTERNRR